MAAVSVALALLSGVTGAGFASGREIVRFFALHGRMACAAVVCALCMLHLLFLRLPAQLERYGAGTLPQLCVMRLGRRFGALCGGLFLLLSAITGGAMLCACAELGALVLPVRHAYGLTLALTLLLCVPLAARGLDGLALPGAALALLMPALLVRLLRLPAGEACFLPAMSPDLPVRAVCDGTAYGALNAAMLAGVLPLLVPLGKRMRRRAVRLFTLLFGGLLLTGVLVCLRHLPAVLHQPLPFVYLSRQLGAGGYLLVAGCMYVAALSTLCAMLSAIMAALPGSLLRRAGLAASFCLVFALAGFAPLIDCGYPALGALCTGLLLVLCAPSGQKDSPSAR
ncbi:MAG: hypothetical protein ACI4MP_14350 [Candidatus Ventricola sp.]